MFTHKRIQKKYLPLLYKEDLLPNQYLSGRKDDKTQNIYMLVQCNKCVRMSNLGQFAQKTVFGLSFILSNYRGSWKCTHLTFSRRNIKKALQELVLIAAILQLEEDQLEVRQAGWLDPGDDCVLNPGAHCQILNLWKVLQAPLLLQVCRAKKSNLQVDWLCASCPLQVQGEAVLLTEVRQGKSALDLNVLW